MNTNDKKPAVRHRADALTYTLEEAADFLNIGVNNMADIANRGEIEAAKIGRGWVFEVEELKRYLRQQAREQTQRRRKQSAPRQSGGSRNPVPDLSQYEQQAVS